MASIKVVLRKKANKDGTFPLALRITKDRKTSFIYLGHNLRPEEWIESEQRVKSSHLNSKRLNHFILTRKTEASDKIIEVETKTDAVSAKTIKGTIKRTSKATFFAQSNLYLEKSKSAGSYNAYQANISRLKVFKEFLNGEDIAFSDITVSLLDRYKMYLQSQRKNSERTIANHLILIRTIFCQAIKENIIDEKHYPFGEDRIRVVKPQSEKIGISAEDFIKLQNVELTHPAHDHARNVWLTCYYFAGMRISDVFRMRWSDFKDGRLHYVMGKNNKPGSVKVLPQVSEILQKYEHLKRSGNDFVFPDLKNMFDNQDKFLVKKAILNRTNRCNQNLKTIARLAKIESYLSTHIARHSFATMAGDKIPVQMLQKLYRHSDVRTTIGYQNNFIYQDADEALEAVINS